jgi:hypothetical protein
VPPKKVTDVLAKSALVKATLPLLLACATPLIKNVDMATASELLTNFNMTYLPLNCNFY